jgi:hypothetical protein
VRIARGHAGIPEPHEVRHAEPRIGPFGDFFARDVLTRPIRQAQELRDRGQEVGRDLQIDTTHPKLGEIGTVAQTLLAQESGTMARDGTGWIE